MALSCALPQLNCPFQGSVATLDVCKVKTGRFLASCFLPCFLAASPLCVSSADFGPKHEDMNDEVRMLVGLVKEEEDGQEQ